MKEYPEPVIVLPDEETAETVNGYKTETSNTESSDEETSSEEKDVPSKGKYIGNKNSKKFHTRECRYAKNMKEENMIIFESLDSARLAGYTSCSVCSN
jgi:DNA/RNA endonuclease YhcR with UshA esterase domain